jgi:hypothetical protein
MSPSSLSAWEEPVIAIDAASRLHTTFGWPKPLVGLQAETLSRFDIVAYDATGAPRIVAVAKKTTRDVDGWIEAASRYLSCPPLEQVPASGEPRGVYNKVVALRRMRAPLLWVVGPGDYERLFRVEHAGDRGTARLNSAEMDALRYDCAFKGPAML